MKKSFLERNRWLNRTLHRVTIKRVCDFCHTPFWIGQTCVNCVPVFDFDNDGFIYRSGDRNHYWLDFKNGDMRFAKWDGECFRYLHEATRADVEYMRDHQLKRGASTFIGLHKQFVNEYLKSEDHG